MFVISRHLFQYLATPITFVHQRVAKLQQKKLISPFLQSWLRQWGNRTGLFIQRRSNMFVKKSKKKRSVGAYCTMLLKSVKKRKKVVEINGNTYILHLSTSNILHLHPLAPPPYLVPSHFSLQKIHKVESKLQSPDFSLCGLLSRKDESKNFPFKIIVFKHFGMTYTVGQLAWPMKDMSFSKVPFTEENKNRRRNELISCSGG